MMVVREVVSVGEKRWALCAIMNCSQLVNVRGAEGEVGLRGWEGPVWWGRRVGWVW